MICDIYAEKFIYIYIFLILIFFFYLVGLGDDDDAGEEKYYFVKMKRHSKNQNGKRPSRVQEGHAYAYDDGTIGVGGWWKTTTGTKEIYSEERASNRKRTILGFKRTLKFYNFKNNKKHRNEATGTNWIMHEYNLNSNEVSDNYLIQFLDTS